MLGFEPRSASLEILCSSSCLMALAISLCQIIKLFFPACFVAINLF